MARSSLHVCPCSRAGMKGFGVCTPAESKTQLNNPKPKENPVKFYAPTTPSTLYNAPFAPNPTPAPALALPTSLYQAPAPILPAPTTLYSAPMAPAVQETYEVPDISIQTYEAPVAPALPVTPTPMMQMDASYNFKYVSRDQPKLINLK